MDVITDPAELPVDLSALDGDTQIGPAVWAKLQGVELPTVYKNNTLANKRRAVGTPKPGDMPAAVRTIGQTPVWSLDAYRAWEAARPGKGAGAGRPRKAEGATPRVRVSLPIDCPHCHKAITAADLRPDESGDSKPAARKRSRAAVVAS